MGLVNAAGCVWISTLEFSSLQSRGLRAIAAVTSQKTKGRTNTNLGSPRVLCPR